MLWVLQRVLILKDRIPVLVTLDTLEMDVSVLVSNFLRYFLKRFYYYTVFFVFSIEFCLKLELIYRYLSRQHPDIATCKNLPIRLTPLRVFSHANLPQLNVTG